MAIAPEMENTERRVPLFGRRSTRRALVAALAGICLLFILFPFMADNVLTWLPPLVILLVGLLLVTNVLLRFATQWLAVAPHRLLDERQEAVRNMAYRLSHRVLAVAFGIPLWLVISYVSSKHHTSPAAGAADLGLVATYLELLYFTPTAIIAWLEPDAVTDEEEDGGFRLPGRVLAVLALILILVAMPFIASASLASPAHGSTLSHLYPGHTSCRYVESSEQVGTLAAAKIEMAGQVCWDGQRVWRSWGLGTTYCQPQFFVFATATMRCAAHYHPDHALDVRYQATVRSPFLPALGRNVTLHVLVGPDGRIRALSRRVTSAPPTVAAVTRHVWYGRGSTGQVHFSMPTGIMPFVTSHPWHLSFSFACLGLHHPRGLPPHTLKISAFGLNLEGGSWGSGASSAASWYTDRGSQSIPMGNGGDFTLSIRALDACRWKVVAQ